MLPELRRDESGERIEYIIVLKDRIILLVNAGIQVFAGSADAFLDQRPQML